MSDQTGEDTTPANIVPKQPRQSMDEAAIEDDKVEGDPIEEEPFEEEMDIKVEKQTVQEAPPPPTPSTTGMNSNDWRALEESVIAIFSEVEGPDSREDLFEKVMRICGSDDAAKMYKKLFSISREQLKIQRNKLEEERDIRGVHFLEKLDKLWTDYCDKMLMIRNVFLDLDRTYVLSEHSMMSLWFALFPLIFNHVSSALLRFQKSDRFLGETTRSERGPSKTCQRLRMTLLEKEEKAKESTMFIFSEIIMDHPYIKDRVIKELLILIDEERAGDKVDRILIRSLVRMFLNLQIYSQLFENAFLEASNKLYSLEGRNLAREMEVAMYLRHVARRLEEENERVEVCLDLTTRRPLISILDTLLIADHMHTIVSRGFDQLVDEDKVEDLALLYQLFCRLPEGLPLLKTYFTEYIKKNGKMIVMNPNRDQEMVPELMRFKDKLDLIVSNSFEGNEKLGQAEKDSFDYFINTRQNKPAELIAKFLDGKLKAGMKEVSELDLDQLMDKIIVLFRFIQGKDIFEAFYKKDLAKRLLLTRSSSVDAEKAMLSKLKQECGSGFTHKLEGMFKDTDLSRDLAQCFKQYVEKEKIALPFEFNVSVLTMGTWPSYEYAQVALPPEMSTTLDLYKSFYIGKHSGKKLQWQHSLATCLLKGTLRPGCVKELQVSMYQALVLLLFNNKPTYSFLEIAEITRIEKNELSRTLQSLACGKIRLLLKTPKGKEVEERDSFEVNTSLNEKLYRIRISQVQMKETAEEHAAVEMTVNQDRQYQIDAAIVRIMKMRKSLPHAQLITELFSQLRFPVNHADLKTRISSLIEREYLARAPEDVNMYTYVS